MVADAIPCCPACGSLIAEHEWANGEWECPNSRCGRLLDPVEVVV
jgi:ribosomal protein L37AE/L43A